MTWCCCPPSHDVGERGKGSQVMADSAEELKKHRCAQAPDISLAGCVPAAQGRSVPGQRGLGPRQLRAFGVSAVLTVLQQLRVVRVGLFGLVHEFGGPSCAVKSVEAVRIGLRDQSWCHKLMATPQCAMAHFGSFCATSSNCFRVSSYQNACNKATPRSNDFCTAGAQEVGKKTVPKCSSAAW